MGALLVRARQRLARVAAQLLEANSEDSLATWNYFDDQIADPTAAAVPSVAGAASPATQSSQPRPAPSRAARA